MINCCVLLVYVCMVKSEESSSIDCCLTFGRAAIQKFNPIQSD